MKFKCTSCKEEFEREDIKDMKTFRCPKCNSKDFEPILKW